MDPHDPDRLLGQIHELQESLREMAQENAALRAERDIALAKVTALLPRATPEQEEELRRLTTGPLVSFDSLIDELTTRRGERNGRK